MSIRRLKYPVRLIIIICFLSSAFNTTAQFEASSGIDLTYPLLLNKENKKLSYDQVSFGLRFGIAYKPAETQFFPILNFSLGRTRLPLVDFNNDVAVLNFNYLNLMLNENYIVRFPQSELYIYGGIGCSTFSSKGLKIEGSGGELTSSAIDSIQNFANLFPAVNIGFEYNYGDYADKDIYLTLGIDFQYILLLPERNTYYITVRDQSNAVTHYNASFTGNVLSPGFYIAIHYLLPHFK